MPKKEHIWTIFYCKGRFKRSKDSLHTTYGLALLGLTNIASAFVIYCASVRARRYKFGREQNISNIAIIGLRLWADGMLFPQQRQAFFVGRYAMTKIFNLPN